MKKIIIKIITKLTPKVKKPSFHVLWAFISIFILTLIAFPVFMQIQNIQQKDLEEIEDNDPLKNNPKMFFNVGRSFIGENEKSTVKLLASTNTNLTITAIQAKIQFSKDIIIAESIDISPSTCKTVFNRHFDNDTGFVNITCLAPDNFTSKAPAFEIASITFKYYNPGTANIKLVESDTFIKNKENFPTTLNGQAASGYYIVSKTNSSKLPGQIQKMTVFSTTHPETNHWYNSKKINLGWLRESGVTDFKYCLNQELKSCTGLSSINQTSLELDAKEGEWYFHIIPITSGKGGPETIFAIKTDNTPPENLNARVNGTDLRYTVKDTTSGVNKIFVTVDGIKYETDSENFSFDKYPLGRYKVVIEIDDEAGNKTTESLTMQIRSAKGFFKKLRSLI
ncbi:hypothetical protein COZ22_02480 [bacterium (Candidatus Howlettbacteria) CG_4_10_14_3_um_filter_37_10]|nr:MAG: hypothetical protein COX25_02740 [bacterium (Candidatus Howlettbacteria) CG23_combo_of_CG06-09_8_20_14_all_37_9]PIX99470.1 MAG: hypothetical protein COZ22_02480 [bacterium (Candidatus Howlettbacteria) CG_4_10_14_3_um_filter_37_10]PJB07343.1 MAG: hypothetical protein CO123_00320 [bacterium (Candidatus Howlettbacteria) CG_4_9_14_3_um_filter_37_10]